MHPSSEPNPGYWRGVVGRATSAIAAARARLARPAQRRPARDLDYYRKGDVYEAVVDVPVSYITSYFDMPFTGGGETVTLPKGERVRVSQAEREKTLVVYCDPLRYEALHDKIVAADERAHERYVGYCLCIPAPALKTEFRLVGDSAGA